MSTVAYRLCKSSIERGSYEYEDMLGKLDLFMFAKRITEEQYFELLELLEEAEQLKKGVE